MNSGGSILKLNTQKAQKKEKSQGLFDWFKGNKAEESKQKDYQKLIKKESKRQQGAFEVNRKTNREALTSAQMQEMRKSQYIRQSTNTSVYGLDMDRLSLSPMNANILQ